MASSFADVLTSRRLIWLVAIVGALISLASAAPRAEADFEVLSFDGTILDQGGDPFTRAGGHPDTATTAFLLPSTTDGNGMPIPDGQMKDVVVELPPGLVGDPTALAKCTAAELAFQQGFADCPPESQVGTVELNSSFGFPFTTPLFNMEAQPGHAAQFGFNLMFVLQLGAEIRPDDYGLSIASTDTPQLAPITSVNPTFWGVPADYGAQSDRKPFLTVPTSCQGPLETKMSISSWRGDLDTASYLTHDNATPPNPIGYEGCENVNFDPIADLRPASQQAETPAALEVSIDVPTEGIKNPDGVSQSHVKQVEVTFPEGMSINPSSASGLHGCSPAEIGLGTDSEAACPDGSKLGTVAIETPILEEDLEGSVYLAKQNDNPFGSLLALYLVAENEERGITIKLAGEVETDEGTGQVSASFDDLPQLPFSRLEMKLKDGSRAALTTPETCGTHQITSKLTPWSAADPDNPTTDEVVTSTSSFQITQGPGGRPCAETKADRPFNPTMQAGVEIPSANAHSPFILNMTRPDGDQELSSFNLAMPQGVTAKLAGVAQCPDATLAAISDAEGTGAGENASPSCPANSQIGKATVGAGAGSNPYYVQTGKAYLAGPYKGAPLSLAVVVPALAGPFDLGSTVVRSSLAVDPRTAQITVQTDPLPQILHGIPLKIRDLRVNVDRDQFTLAGTNCDPMQVGASVQGSHGATATLANRFQVGDCGSLGFSPKLKLDFGNKKKDTKRNQHPPLTANLAFNEGDANISSVQVALPEGVLLDQERIGKVCSREAYAASSCPAASQVGYAKATTPLLDQPVEGPVYLKASDNVLPDLAADLNGQIDIDLFGRIDQREGKRVSRIQNTFDVVPDVPVSDFELTLAGGNDGLLVNSSNVCKSKRSQRVSIDITAHNEMSTSSNPLIGSACKQINKKKAKKLKRKAAKLLRKAKKADSKKKSKKLRKQARKLKRQARKLGR